MKVLQAILGGYLLIGLVYGVYRHFKGAEHVLTAFDFGVHISHALFWPIFMFPGFGKFLGGIVLMAVIGGLVLGKSRG